MTFHNGMTKKGKGQTKEERERRLMGKEAHVSVQTYNLLLLIAHFRVINSERYNKHEKSLKKDRSLYFSKKKIDNLILILQGMKYI